MWLNNLSTSAPQHKIPRDPFPSQEASCPCPETPVTSISADRRIITSISWEAGCLCPEMPVKWLDVKEMDQFKDIIPTTCSGWVLSVIMKDTHSVRAAVDGDPRLSSLTHSDRDVALRVGEPHVDHWNISIFWKVLLRNPKLCIHAFNPLSLCDKPFSWSSPCPSQMHIQLPMTSIGIHFNNVRW